jgi:hypothetical protein
MQSSQNDSLIREICRYGKRANFRMIKFNIDKQIKCESKVTDRQLILKTSNMEVSSEIGLKFSDLIYSDFIEDL